MKTQIWIKDKLLKKAQKISDHKDLEKVVSEALELYISINRQKEIRKLRGNLKWEGNLSEMRS